MKYRSFLHILAFLALLAGPWTGASAAPAGAVEPEQVHAATAITVNSVKDEINSTDGHCTLREAIIAANTNSASGAVAGECPAGSRTDTISLTAGTYPFNIGADGGDDSGTANPAKGDLDILDDVTITGAGTSCATAGPQCTKISAGQLDRVFDIAASAEVTITQLGIYSGSPAQSTGGGGVRNKGTLTMDQVTFVANQANSSMGGGLRSEGTESTVSLSRVSFANNTASIGGGIYSTSPLTLENVSITQSSATNRAGCLYSGNISNFSHLHLSSCQATDGAGILNEGMMTIAGATIKSNASTNNGGGVYNSGMLTMTNVTLSGNTASNYGAGIYTNKPGSPSTTTLINVTISNNTAANGGSAIALQGTGVFSLKNSLLDSPTEQNCLGTFTSAGHNLDSGVTCGLNGTGDLTGQDPLLAALSYDGASLDTHALLTGSPAIDAGDNVECPASDARGIARPKDGDGNGAAVCDIGAYEAYTPTLSTFLPFVIR